jgi:hypothetical protein
MRAHEDHGDQPKKRGHWGCDPDVVPRCCCPDRGQGGAGEGKGKVAMRGREVKARAMM